MGQQVAEAAYDRYAGAYRDWWAPVIAPAATRLLDRVAPRVDSRVPLDLVDVGVGTGTLALAALERWPQLSVVGVDPSAAMLEIAASAAVRRGRAVAARLRLLRGEAERLPLGDAAVDGALSSFVIQLVSSRAATLREMHRVVRPGGFVAIVTWQVHEAHWEPHDTVGRTLEEFGIRPAAGGGDPRPYTSPRAAAAELRRIGFKEVSSRLVWLEHAFTPQSYLDVVEHWVEDEAFAGLAPTRRVQVRRELLRRLRRLDRSQLVWRRPLVSALARRP